MMAETFRDWIGRSVTREDVASPRLLAEYRATLEPFLFRPDDDTACPPGFHFGLAPATPAMTGLAPDGSEARGALLPPIPLPRRMWAGGAIETHGPVVPGARVRRVSTVADVQYREGKSGALYFVSVRHEIESDGKPAVTERQDLVFRAEGSKPSSGQAVAIPAGGLRWTVPASAILLFRFSAFTFNGHRIHYDESYCREEGYPGLVVHGPMQAALMFNQAAAAMGTVPRRFDYRCVAPLFPDFTVHAMKTGGGASSRIIRHDGITTAEGQADAPGT